MSQRAIEAASHIKEAAASTISAVSLLMAEGDGFEDHLVELKMQAEDLLGVAVKIEVSVGIRSDLLELFPDLQATPRGFSDLVATGNKKSVIDYLTGLPEQNFIEEVCQAGFKMIGFHHGRPAVIEYVLNQID
tara:strand:- start:25876 stop:26274 length:399 start_codon:yes stop_codon:yes gene_type:complete